MSTRKGNRFSEAIVGFFMVALVLLLAYFTIVISGVDALCGKGRMRVHVAFEGVGGLKDHDSVMYRGTKVGIVERVTVTPTNLVVTADIDPNVILRRGYRVAVCNLSMLGGNYLLLEEGTGEPVDVKTTMLKGETPSDWMRDIAEVSHNLRALTEMQDLKTIITNAAIVSAKAVVFTENATRFTDRATELADKAIAFADRANAIAGQVAGVSDQVSNIVARVERGEGTLGRILSKDEALYADLKGGISAFRKAAENFDAKGTVERANELLGNLNAVAKRLRNGDGTLGKLLSSDDRAYEEICGLIRDVRQIIDNYRDTTPISTFSSLATGAL